MRIIDVDYLMQNMREETAFILKCEELFHDKISSAAAKVIENMVKGRRIVCLTGPSGSGKTTTAFRLRDYLHNLTVPVIMLSMDNFFLPAALRPPEATDFESPFCVDIPRLTRCARDLFQGKKVEVPTFDFKTSEYGPSYEVQGDKEAVIILEGIHMLNPLIFNSLRSMALGIYASPRTRVLTADEKVIHPHFLRVARRMLRDSSTRGRSLQETVLNMESVNAGERLYITPHRHNAEIHLDTFHDYEPCILAHYLKELPSFQEELTPEFVKAHELDDLIGLVEQLPPLKTSYIPRDSLLREFIGGSIYQY
ncbi:MAG: hypothetical protein IJT60_06295 [Clostridia bacterium]|nr:hypothetical protein [Clostridia bacterium]